ncbi:MAG: FHA domain-containing protein [Myxococcaceae bacterium]
MLSVQDMKSLARSLSLEKFKKQVGPFALIQRPPGQAAGSNETDKMGLPPAAQVTRMSKAGDASGGALALLFGFDDLIVATLPPLQGVDELSVGRQPDCDLIVDDPSVSKQHAVLRWDDKTQRCTVKDLESTNGTFLNASIMVRRETPLRDGDIVSFGEVQFWYMLAETLHSKLANNSTARIGARSG